MRGSRGIVDPGLIGRTNEPKGVKGREERGGEEWRDVDVDVAHLTRISLRYVV